LRFEHAHVTTDEERYAAGRSARKAVPRGAHADYRPQPDRDPLGILDRQHAGRLPHLIPLRIERMLQDPFGFFRGTAALQAADLAGEPTTDAGVVLCGDAHIGNFGIFATAERSLVFDLNDFDEAAFGPWEWDVKRLVTSVVIAARHRGADEKTSREHASTAVRAYRAGLRLALKRDGVERFFRTAQVRRGRSMFGPETAKIVDAAIRATEKRTSARAVEKLTEVMPNGSRQLVDNPPRLVHLEPEQEGRVEEILARYRASVPANVALLLSQHEVTDVARLVSGVGSVGTRCFIIVMTGPRREPLVLQLKEAGDSVVNEFGGVPIVASPGAHPELVRANPSYRVVAGQRILQAASDPLLGWFTAEGSSFYVRQFRNRSVSFDTDTMSEQTFGDYATACGMVLGAAHARSPNGAFISGYIGRGESFADAVVAWSHAYADQSLADFEALRDAASAGRYAVT
jgi:uncharacterized protein (DUF2252 family)